MNVRCIPNRNERHGNVTASKASVADTLHDRLVRKGSKGCDDFFHMFKKSPHVRSSFESPYIRHAYAVRTKVTQHERSTIVATPQVRGKCICRVPVAYEALSWCTYGVHFLPIAYRIRLNGVLFQSLAYRGVCTTYERRTCDAVAFLLRTFGVAGVTTTSMRRSQAKSFPRSHFFKVMDVVELELNMSPGVRKPTIWILTRSDSNQAVQPLKMARGWKFWI